MPERKLTKLEVRMLHQAINNLSDVIDIIFPPLTEDRYEVMDTVALGETTLEQLRKRCVTASLGCYGIKEAMDDEGNAGEESV